VELSLSGLMDGIISSICMCTYLLCSDESVWFAVKFLWFLVLKVSLCRLCGWFVFFRRILYIWADDACTRIFMIVTCASAVFLYVFV
jgi:hypothetical protein